MEIAVDFIEEITCTTVNYKIKRVWLKEMCKIYYSILLPSLWILLNRAKTLRDSPFLREW